MKVILSICVLLLLGCITSPSFEADLVKDMLSLIAVFSAKLYSQRGKDNRKKRTVANGK